MAVVSGVNCSGSLNQFGGNLILPFGSFSNLVHDSLVEISMSESYETICNYIFRSSFSASIRRSSMREKSLISWKEARQEALIREAVEKKIIEPKMESGVDSNYSSLINGNGVNGKDKIEVVFIIVRSGISSFTTSNFYYVFVLLPL